VIASPLPPLDPPMYNKSIYSNIMGSLFQLFIRSYPLAQALNLKYCRDHNKETLRYIYEQEDDYAAQAACSIREAYEPKVEVL
jgi:hypothetical protein